MPITGKPLKECLIQGPVKDKKFNKILPRHNGNNLQKKNTCLENLFFSNKNTQTMQIYQHSFGN